VEGVFPIFFLAVVLKIPVGLLLYLVWWAFRAQPEVEEAPPGADDHEFRRYRRDPRRPGGPRRGPHAPDSLPLPACPPGGRNRTKTPAAPVRAGARTPARRGSAERV
jgi:hypothetical protein